ncbi:hypothetical protein AVEN_203953-1 [Araneus ventricosus]|uniref:Uncharacterized protein n=1 Tax=Araneus ventricosus TaxID=182803 RepID=A0A4Y2U3V2_ARAVE|nr:hypothetical protein AVEN_261019-1 [Araneus ventricosus]GBO07655.1 hypothetical protein AVEN_37478-1 [Araneus ventricosus]GBO07663.1 hypothetical protein AVEN_141051-1 [Araneus ventricosus]GBO07671.1 hypothetical protein AVEN_203953-1 [Araneus ventricosus]
MQYLLHAVVPTTKASWVVESFPATAEKYPKAIAQLKERFGLDDLLVQIYRFPINGPEERGLRSHKNRSPGVVRRIRGKNTS